MNYCQSKIKNVLIVGLGGVGTVYANIIDKNPNIDLKILVDSDRFEKYLNNPRFLNNEVCDFQFITPSDEFNPDLVIISTKSNGLDNAISLVKPFIKESTLILSFINGLSSERKLAEHFNEKQILHSYIICHTITRNGNNIEHDGITKVVWGDKTNSSEKIKRIKGFFDETNIDYEFSHNIIKALWEKFCFNCCVNQISAITGFTFEQMWKNKECLTRMEKISQEINLVANAYGIKDAYLVDTTFKNLHKMIPTGKTSMLQDIENGRTPELDLFGAEVIRMANDFNINIPENIKLYEELKEFLNKKGLL